jgi:hypothetical protein
VRRLDRVHRGEAPAHHLRLAGAVSGDQAAGLLGQVDEDGSGFGHHQPVVVDRRDLFEGAEPAIGFGVQVVRGVVHAGQLERQLHLLERPQHAQVAGVAARDSVDLGKAVELEHGDVRRCDRTRGTSHACRGGHGSKTSVLR